VEITKVLSVGKDNCEGTWMLRVCLYNDVISVF